jgi:hypothetical protein
LRKGKPMTDDEQGKIKEIETLIAQHREQIDVLQRQADVWQQTLDRLHALGVKLIESGQNLALPPDFPPYMPSDVVLDIIKNTYGKAVHDVLEALFHNDYSFLESAIQETVIKWENPALDKWFDADDMVEC